MDDDDLKSSHTLIELSHNQWIRYCDNSIIVSGIKEEKLNHPDTHFKYSNVVFSTNICVRKSSRKYKDKIIRWKAPILQNISGRYCMIVGDKKRYCCMIQT